MGFIKKPRCERRESESRFDAANKHKILSQSTISQQASAERDITVFDMGRSRETLGQRISNHEMRAQRGKLDNPSKDEVTHEESTNVNVSRKKLAKDQSQSKQTGFSDIPIQARLSCGLARLAP